MRANSRPQTSLSRVAVIALLAVGLVAMIVPTVAAHHTPGEDCSGTVDNDCYICTNEWGRNNNRCSAWRYCSLYVDGTCINLRDVI